MFIYLCPRLPRIMPNTRKPVWNLGRCEKETRETSFYGSNGIDRKVKNMKSGEGGQVDPSMT